MEKKKCSTCRFCLARTVYSHYLQLEGTWRVCLNDQKFWFIRLQARRQCTLWLGMDVNHIFKHFYTWTTQNRQSRGEKSTTSLLVVYCWSKTSKQVPVWHDWSFSTYEVTSKMNVLKMAKLWIRSPLNTNYGSDSWSTLSFFLICNVCLPPANHFFFEY